MTHSKQIFGVAALAAASLFAFATPGQAKSFIHVGEAKPSDLEFSLAQTLAEDDAPGSRLGRLEVALNATYASLPKEADGKLGHQAVRYAVHRFFIQRSGWFIRGLEPKGEEFVRKAPWGEKFVEWVPNFLQDQLEQRLGGRGASLRDLAAVVAAFDDLVHREAQERLRTVYEVHEIPTNATTPTQETQDILDTYFQQFLLRGDFEVNHTAQLQLHKKQMGHHFRAWPWARQWAKQTLTPYFPPEDQAAYDFAYTVRRAKDLGQGYHEHYYEECDRLTSALHGMEGQQEGRIRLSKFYKARRYSHWSFEESIDYLRVLGALDDSDPVSPSVIITNYVLTRPNCFEPTHIYAICCENKCESLMARVESAFGKPEVSPKAMADHIATLPSESVAAPRNLSESLIARLDQVADANGGTVPLHGRLFAQWMHHAYPRECPYPHPKGEVSPQTPEEWLRKTGQDVASAEEMAKVIADDVCVSDNGGLPQPDSCRNTELPWSDAEELLTSCAKNVGPRSDNTQESIEIESAATTQAQSGVGWGANAPRPDNTQANIEIARQSYAAPQAEQGAGKNVGFLLLAVSAIFVASSLALPRHFAVIALPEAHAHGASQVLVCALLALALWAVNILSASMLAVGLICGGAMLAASHVTTRLAQQAAAGVPKAEAMAASKCLV